MAIIRTAKTENYSVISNRPLNDERLSFAARGLLAYLLSKPNNWEVSVSHLATVSPAGRDAVRSLVSELLDVGYLQVLEQGRDNGGKFGAANYVVVEDPDTQHEGTEQVAAPVVQRKARKSKPLTQIPDDFKITDEMWQWAMLNGVTSPEGLELVTREFVLHWQGSGKKKADWLATWRTWVLGATVPDTWKYRSCLTNRNYSPDEVL